MEMITFTGLKYLNDDEKAVLNDVSSRHYPKLQMLLHNEVSVNVHVKIYKPKEIRKKYSVTIKVAAPTMNVFNSSAYGWILQNVLNDAYVAVIKHIRTHFKK